MTLQKQRKQLILIDSKNILTCCFQPIPRLQPNFKTDGIRNFMYTKQNGDKVKLRIFSFIPQRQRIQPNFANHTYQTTKQTNTTRTTKTTTSTWVSPLTQSFCSCYWDNAYSGVFIFKFRNKLTNLYTSSIPKNMYVAWWTISYISSIPTRIRCQVHWVALQINGLVSIAMTGNPSWKKLRSIYFPYKL